MTVPSLTSTDTSPGAPPLQPVGLLAAAEAVDEGAELLHVMDVLRRDHLLLDDVRLRQVRPFLHVNQQLPQVAWRHHDSGVQLDDVAFIQRYVMISCQTSLEVVDDICRVAPSELRHRDIDLLIVLLNVNLDVFMQLQLPLERRVQRVFVKDAAVKHALTGKLGDEEVSVDIHRSEDQAEEQYEETHGQVAHPTER